MAQQSVTVTGNLTDDPILSETVDGKKHVCRIRIAASRSVRDKDDSDKWVTYDQLYITGEMWGELATNVKASLKRGMPVIATGYIVTDEWQDGRYKDEHGNLLRRQNIKLKIFQIGLDLNRYIVASRRSDAGGHTPDGMQAPDAVNVEELVDSHVGEKREAVMAGAQSSEVADPPF